MKSVLKIIQEEISAYGKDMSSIEKQARAIKRGGGSDTIQANFNENFWRWFNGSKVVNADGSPKLMYHGTTEDFDAFEKGKFGFHFGTYEQAKDITINNRGQYLKTDAVDSVGDPKYELTYGNGSNMMPVYLSIKNPVEIDDPGADEPEKIIEGIRNYLPEEEVKYLGSLTPDRSADSNKIEYQETYARKEIIRILLSHGFDGCHYINTVEGLYNSDDHEAWIAFKPQQIKSATGNNGEFSNSPDITKENMDVNGIINEEPNLIQEEFTGDGLYGYHCTPCKNVESIEQTGFRIGTRSMQGNGVYAFYNLRDNSSGNAALGYGMRHIGDEFCIVKFRIGYPRLITMVIKSIAEDVLGADADIVKQLERQFNDWDDYMNKIFRYMSPEYRTPEFAEQHKNWMREKFNMNNEIGSQELMFGKGYLADVAKYGIIFYGEYGISYLIKSPHLMQPVGYYNVKTIGGRITIGEYIPFNSGMKSIQDKINTDDKFKPLREYLPQIQNVEDLNMLRHRFNEKQMEVRNNREFDLYQNLIDLIDELI